MEENAREKRGSISSPGLQGDIGDSGSLPSFYPSLTCTFSCTTAMSPPEQSINNGLRPRTASEPDPRRPSPPGETDLYSMREPRPVIASEGTGSPAAPSVRLGDISQGVPEPGRQGPPHIAHVNNVRAENHASPPGAEGGHNRNRIGESDDLMRQLVAALQAGMKGNSGGDGGSKGLPAPDSKSARLWDGEAATLSEHIK